MGLLVPPSLASRLRCPQVVEYGRSPVSVSNGKNNRCHEAIQIYALVEADAERQIIEKTEFPSEKTRVVKIDADTPTGAKTVLILLSLDKAAVVNGVR